MFKAKRVLLAALLFFGFSESQSQTQLWYEDFEAEAIGATSGTAAGTPGGTWSVTTTPSGGAASFSKQAPAAAGGLHRFHVNETNSEGVWETNVITIPGGYEVAIDVDLVTYNADANDYIRMYYKLDGGAEVLFGSIIGAGALSVQGNASIVLTGSTVQIIARGKEDNSNPTGDSWLRFDNLEVSQIRTLYSRVSAITPAVTNSNWGTNGTWSTVGLGGASCNCTPDNTSNVVIGNNDIVNITAESDVVRVTVQNTGTLRWTAAVDLNITRGGSITVSDNASITRNSNAGAQIDFDIGATNTITINSSNANALAPGDIEINGGATLTFGGTGSVSLGDDFLLNTTGTVNVTNNLGGTLTIGDDLNFNTSNATVTNNGRLTITGDIVATDASDDDNVLTNSSGATLGVAIINPNSSDMDVLNSGIINQSNTFSNLSAADTNFDNLATGTWNWNFGYTTVPTNLNTILDLTTAGNTFNYGASGNQRIIPIQHHHIGLSGSGAKDANNASITIKGNWTVSGTATFTEGTGTITLSGSANSQTITNPSGETFNILTINNTYTTEPQIILNDNVSVSLTLNMTDGVIQSDANNILIMLNASSTTVGSAASYVSGPMRYNMAVSATTRTLNFPIGKNSLYGGASLRVTHTAATSYTYTAEVIASSAMALNYTLAAGTDRVSNLRYWNITRGTTAAPNVTSNANLSTGTVGTAPRLTLYYVAEDEVNQPSTLTVVKNVNGGSVWFNTVGTASGSPSGSIVTSDPSTNFTSFSFFTLANLTGGTNPLPIELLSFSAVLRNDAVELKWSTASETNNDHFTIERSTHPEHFEAIAEEDGKGTAKQLNTYRITDPSPLYGRSYYRLKQTDFDGKFTYSELRTIDYDGPAFATLTAFPNPVNTQTLTLKIEGLKDASELPVQILNLRGQKVFDKVIEVKTPGVITEEISRDNFPSPGLYIIKAGETLYLTKKIVIE